MHIEYSERLKQSPAEFALAQYGTNRLEQAAATVEGPPTDVSGAWDCTDDEAGQPVLTLRLSKADGDTVVGKIPADELRSPWLTGYQVNHLLGDLVMIDVKRRVARFGSEN